MSNTQQFRSNVSYGKEENAWLREHTEINKSAVFRKIIKYMMRTGRVIVAESDLERVTVDTIQKAPSTTCEEDA